MSEFLKGVIAGTIFTLVVFSVSFLVLILASCTAIDRNSRMYVVRHKNQQSKLNVS